MPRTKGAKSGKYGSAIDKEKFEKLCSILCTQEEICLFFGVSDDTVKRWCKQTYGKTYSQVYREKCVIGKTSLRRYQFKQAQNNPVMAIWLGKQFLNQTDKVEQTTQDFVSIVNDVPKTNLGRKEEDSEESESVDDEEKGKEE